MFQIIPSEIEREIYKFLFAVCLREIKTIEMTETSTTWLPNGGGNGWRTLRTIYE